MNKLRRIVAGAADAFQRTFGTRPAVAPAVAIDARPTRARTVRATFPNAGVAAWYRQRLDGILRQMVAQIIPEISTVWNESQDVIGFAADAPSRSALLRKALEKWGGLWTRRLEKLSDQLAEQFADKSFTATDISLQAAFRDAGLTVKFKTTAAQREAFQAVVAENVSLIKSIPAQFAKDVETQVWSSVMKGADLQELTDGIRSRYAVGQRRAELIARDQNAKAKAVLENTRRQELGITKAIWMHSHAGKEPRPSHVAMDGKTFELSKGMWDKDAAKWVWPGTEINCRCTSRAIIPGFED